MLGVLGHVLDDEAQAIIDGLMDPLPPGTYRTPPQLGRLFARLDPVEPGLVSCTRWRPEATPFGEPEEIDRLELRRPPRSLGDFFAELARAADR
jgi:hypothetical protein